MPDLFAAMSESKLWYLVPLLVSISMVYASTRHEHLGPIVIHAVRFAIWLLIAMAVVFVAVLLMSQWV
jgi:hypothetical protein